MLCSLFCGSFGLGLSDYPSSAEEKHQNYGCQNDQRGYGTCKANAEVFKSVPEIFHGTDESIFNSLTVGAGNGFIFLR